MVIDPGESGPARRLGLRVEELNQGSGAAGLTVVTIRVDGEEIFARAGGGYFRGWHPALILDPDDAPLLPAQPARRVGLYPRNAIVVAEDCVTAIIAAEADRIAWRDIRSFIGYHEPVEPYPDISEGEPFQIPDLIFDSAQYRAEVQRATADRSWETDELKAARLLRQHLRQAQDRLAAHGWRPEFAEARRAGGFWVAFRDPEDAQLIVALAPKPGTAEQQAAMMAGFLLTTPPQNWPVIHHSARGLDDPHEPPRTSLGA